MGTWEEGQQGQLIPTDPRDIPGHTCSAYRAGGSWLGVAARELAGHQSVGGEELNCASLVLYSLIILSSSLIIIIIIVIIIIISLSCPIKLSLAQPTDFTFFLPVVSQLTVREKVSGWLCSVQLPARLSPTEKPN